MKRPIVGTWVHGMISEPARGAEVIGCHCFWWRWKFVNFHAVIKAEDASADPDIER
jgi:hypothetical protein